jgi:hypothetical protein
MLGLNSVPVPDSNVLIDGDSYVVGNVVFPNV